MVNCNLVYSVISGDVAHFYILYLMRKIANKLGHEFTVFVNSAGRFIIFGHMKNFQNEKICPK